MQTFEIPCSQIWAASRLKDILKSTSPELPVHTHYDLLHRPRVTSALAWRAESRRQILGIRILGNDPSAWHTTPLWLINPPAWLTTAPPWANSPPSWLNTQPYWFNVAPQWYNAPPSHASSDFAVIKCPPPVIQCPSTIHCTTFTVQCVPTGQDLRPPTLTEDPPSSFAGEDPSLSPSERSEPHTAQPKEAVTPDPESGLAVKDPSFSPSRHPSLP